MAFAGFAYLGLGRSLFAFLVKRNGGNSAGNPIRVCQCALWVLIRSLQLALPPSDLTNHATSRASCSEEESKVTSTPDLPIVPSVSISP